MMIEVTYGCWVHPLRLRLLSPLVWLGGVVGGGRCAVQAPRPGRMAYQVGANGAVEAIGLKGDLGAGLVASRDQPGHSHRHDEASQ